MSDKLKVACPNCQKRYAVAADMAGKKVKCGCGTKFRVPGNSAAGAGAVAGAETGIDTGPRDEADLLADALSQQSAGPASAQRSRPAAPVAGHADAGGDGGSGGGGGAGGEAFDPLAAPAAFDPLTAPPAVGGGGETAGQRKPLKTARTATGGDACPQCGIAVSPNAVICTQCGYHLLTGEVHRTRVGESDHGPVDEEISWGAIFVAPFHGQVMGTAVFITIGAFGWYSLIGVALASCLIFYQTLGVWGVIPGLLGAFVVALAAAGWIFRGMAEMAAAVQSDTVTAESDRGLVSSMGHAFLVGLIALPPQIVVGVIALVLNLALLSAALGNADAGTVAGAAIGTVALLIVLNLLAQLWFVTYAPFAIAVDGAYDEINPIDVIRRMFTLAGPFFTTLGMGIVYYVVLFILITIVTWTLSLLGWVLATQLPPIILDVIAGIISATLTTFGYTAHVAIVARMLRRYRDY